MFKVMIGEGFLHYLWKFQLFSSEYLNYRGQKIEVIDPGMQNAASGPDFFNARIKIGEMTWIGNVEIHVRSSDWFRHSHHKDPVYDNIILHMVMIDDANVCRKSGEEIPFGRFNIHPELIRKYENLVESGDQKLCYGKMKDLEKSKYYDFIGKLGFSRLQRKTELVDEIMNGNHSEREETLYQVLAIAFGQKYNSEPFRMLARSIPYGFILKNREKQITVLAAFYGQAGFLDNDIDIDNDFYKQLRKEYKGIKKLLPAQVLNKSLWKKKGNRPSGFPEVRIFQFAEILRRQMPIFNKLADCKNSKEIFAIISQPLKNSISKNSIGQKTWFPLYMPGSRTINLWIINGILPVLFSFGKFHKNEGKIQLVLDILEELPPENNELLKKWNKFGMIPGNAFESQALIELKTMYCQKQRCTDCLFGHQILSDDGKK